MPLPPRPFWLIAAAAWGGLFALHRRRAGGAPLALAGIVLLPWHAAPASIEVHALDVGHGTAVVIRAPGEPCLVFDAGSRDRPRLASEALGPCLARWEVRRPRVVLSHDHADHRSALGCVQGLTGSLHTWSVMVNWPIGYEE